MVQRVAPAPTVPPVDADDELDQFVAAHPAVQQTARPAAATPAPEPDDLDSFVAQHPAIVDNAEYRDLSKPRLSESHDIIGDILKGTSTGLLKRAGSTIYGAGQLFSKIPGIPSIAEAFGADPEFAEFRGEDPEELVPRNKLEKFGGFLTDVGLSFIPGGLVEKSIRATKGLSTARRIGEAMWREALSSAGTAAVQTGGDVGASAAAGLTGGLVRGAFSAPGFLRDDKLAQEYLNDAIRYGWPITAAEKTQGAIKRLTEAIVRRRVGGYRRFAHYDVERNELIKETVDSIIQAVDPNVMEPRAAGEFIQSGLEQVKTIAREELSQATDDILGPAGNSLLNLGKVSDDGSYEPGPLVEAARDVIKSHKMEELKNLLGSSVGGTDDVNRAYSILQRIADPFDEVPIDPIEAAITGQTSKRSLRSLDLATAREARTLFFDLADSDVSTRGKGAIKQLNRALHDEIIATLNREGLQSEAQAFERASANYKKTLDLLMGEHGQSDVLKRITDRDPSAVLPLFKGLESQTAIENLTRTIGPDKVKRVRAAAVSEMVRDAMHPNGLFMVERFKRSFDKMTPEAQNSIYGPELAKELRLFADAAEKYKLTPDVMGKAEGMSLPFMSQIAMGAGGRSLSTGVIVGGATGSAKTAAIAAGAQMAAETVGAMTSNILARMMTRPAVVHDLRKALTADPMSTAGKQLAARISAYIARATQEERQEHNRSVALELKSQGPESAESRRAAELEERVRKSRASGEFDAEAEEEYDRLLRSGGGRKIANPG